MFAEGAGCAVGCAAASAQAAAAAASVPPPLHPPPLACRAAAAGRLQHTELRHNGAGRVPASVAQLHAAGGPRGSPGRGVRCGQPLARPCAVGACAASAAGRGQPWLLARPRLAPLPAAAGTQASLSTTTPAPSWKRSPRSSLKPSSEATLSVRGKAGQRGSAFVWHGRDAGIRCRLGCGGGGMALPAAPPHLKQHARLGSGWGKARAPPALWQGCRAPCLAGPTTEVPGMCAFTNMLNGLSNCLRLSSTCVAVTIFANGEPAARGRLRRRWHASACRRWRPAAGCRRQA